jgi:hypothetical protein
MTLPVTAPRKYRNLPSMYKEEKYDSKGEAAYAQHLDYLVAAGQLAWWQRGKPVALLPEVETKADQITYRPDFVISPAPDGETGWVDYKGVLTQVFRLKVKLWKRAYPGNPLYVVGKDYALRRLA